jgi:Fe-S cluster assembly ATP-binding protein
MLITNLCVTREDKTIIEDFSLSLEPGSIHALMGPNGSGKSSLAYALIGHSGYTIKKGTIALNNEDITQEPLHKRAQKGIFLSFQQPISIPGLSVMTFLQETYRALKGDVQVGEFYAILIEKMDILGIDYAFTYRNVNEGFSGGERKKFEMLQLLLVQPCVAILDEIDSGLDIDALKVIAHGLHYLREKNPNMRLLIITHYQRILNYITPNYVHILCKGRLVRSGDADIIQDIEKHGYQEEV